MPIKEPFMIELEMTNPNNIKDNTNKKTSILRIFLTCFSKDSGLKTTIIREDIINIDNRAREVEDWGSCS